MSFKTLLLSQNDVAGLLNEENVLSIVEDVFRAHGNDDVILPPKITLDLGEEGQWPAFWGGCNSMPSYIRPFDAAGIKFARGYRYNRQKGLPSVIGTIILNDSRTGLPLAVMDGTLITNMRTGCVAGVCAKYLAKCGSYSRVAIIGAGAQGTSSLKALSYVLQMAELRIFDVSTEASQRLTHVATELGLDAKAAVTVEEACNGADVVVTATPSFEPLVEKGWIKKGATVIALGTYQEVETSLILEADKIIVDSWAQIEHRGQLFRLIQSGLISKDSIYAEVGDIVAGRRLGRENEDETIVVTPIGMGSHDIAVAKVAYMKAIASGKGEFFEFF